MPEEPHNVSDVDEQVIAALAAAPTLPMPDQVWARLQSQLVELSQNRQAAADGRTTQVQPSLPKDVDSSTHASGGTPQDAATRNDRRRD